MSVWKSKIVLGATCTSVGAGVVVLLLGVPSLQTESAAAWASALATFLAAVVALGVGVLPTLKARTELDHQAKFAGKIVAGGLALQELNLRVVARLGERDRHMVNHWVDKEMAALLAQVNASEAMQLAPYIKVLPSDLADALVKCIGMLQSCERTVATRTKTIPYEVRYVLGDCAWFEGVAACIADLRTKLCDWTGAEEDDVLGAVTDTAESVRIDADGEMDRFQRHNAPSSVKD